MSFVTAGPGGVIERTYEADHLVHRTRTPVAGGVIGGPQGLGGNGLLVRRFYVDLDASTPTAKYFDGNERESALFSMKNRDTEVFLLVGAATRDRHEWTVSIPCTVDGVAVNLPVRGDPLVTVGPEGVPLHYWTEGVGWRKSE